MDKERQRIKVKQLRDIDKQLTKIQKEILSANYGLHSEDLILAAEYLENARLRIKKVSERKVRQIKDK